MNIEWQLSDPWWSYLVALVIFVGFLALYYAVVRKRHYEEQKRRSNPVKRTWAWWWRSVGSMIYWTFVLGVLYAIASFMLYGQPASRMETLESIFNGATIGVLLFWLVLPFAGMIRIIRGRARRARPGRKV